MLRRLFNLAVVVSLLLCVGVLVLWARSHRQLIGVRLQVGTTSLDVGLPAGQLVIAWGDRRPGPGVEALTSPEPVHMGRDFRAQTNVTEFRSFLGFGWYRLSTDNTVGLLLPCWFLVALLAAMPAAWVRGRVKMRTARQRGLCGSCGYDLRASPGRCPECGAVAQAQLETAV